MTAVSISAAAKRPTGHDPAPWGDTLPACFRSEAFAEDLDGAAGPAAAPQAVGATPRLPTLAWGILPRLAWR